MTATRFLLLFLSLGAAAAEPEVRVTLATETSGGMLRITPLVESAAERRLRYEVIARKIGPSGRSENRQSGDVQVRCCKPVSASTLAWNVAPGDRYRVTVRILSAGEVVAETTLEHP